jgi:hypothetical protein
MSLSFQYISDESIQIKSEPQKFTGCHKILNNFIKNDLFNKMNSNFLDDDKVNYGEYDEIIAQVIQQLKVELNWEPIATKYRVSEGKQFKTSNSTDASNFHRDVNIYEGEDIPEIYTLVIYLDQATLDIIPQSCTKFRDIELGDVESIHFKPGDAILFNACNLHRGSFETKYKSQTRKCIQIFEIYKNKEDYSKYAEKMFTIPGGNNKMVEYMSQSWNNIPLLNTYIKHYGRKFFIKKIPRNNENDYAYLSVEAQRPRALKNIDYGNKYRMLLKTHDSVNPARDYANFGKGFVTSILVMPIVTLFVLLFLLKKIINSINGKKNKPRNKKIYSY